VVLRDFECPNCGAHEMGAGVGQTVVCLYCGTPFGDMRRICPECGHYNEESVRHCSECGAQIVRDCAACGADNSVLADHCGNCGQNLDLIDRIAQRWQLTTERRLSEQRTATASLRKEVERASEERMAEYLEVERQRQEALALARASQRIQERRLYIVASVALALLGVIMVLVFIWTYGGG
jgi:hypothetical protein